MHAVLNDSNMLSPVDANILQLWNLCNGVSFHNLLTYYSTALNKPINVIESLLESDLNKMVQAGILEVREMDEQNANALLQNQKMQNTANMNAQMIQQMQSNIMYMWHGTNMRIINNLSSSLR